ncbi:MBL fold metallo-hydrolase [Ruoffia tabacinasalis]|uniref:MBL fold metallo-hydrolase n=1 Tax=Ruoffia tabacinasalis TaxID=87458 RepID=A0ABS0LGT9_9LACT|nr:MBL fold metallo-hydrolase [Ruoffia tabacinasalis]MBG9977496.1 MBL fold metallo-hydrolase [Ruoffia tabacinasalis]
MKLDILGFWGGTPEEGGATTGYLLHTSKGTLLIDCGSGIMSRLSTLIKFYEIDAVLLTHLHFDHIADYGILQYGFNRALRNKWVEEPLYTLAPNKPDVMWKAIQANEAQLEVIEENFDYSLIGATVEFLSVSHTIPCYAIKVTYEGKIFVFSADTAYFEPLIDFAKDADLFLCEATNFEGSIHSTGTGHMSASEAGKLAQKARVKTLILTHLPSDGNFSNMKDEAKAEFNGEVLMASDIDSLTF